MKHKTSLIAAIVLVIAGCVLRFAMPGHDFLGYTLWGIAVLVFLFPRLHRVGRIVLGVLIAVFTQRCPFCHRYLGMMFFTGKKTYCPHCGSDVRAGRNV